jgi:hypothetical protein
VSAGVLAKLVFRTRDPYRVIRKLGNGTSYHIGRLPFIKDNGVPGKILKEATACMEKLPSRLIIAKKADGADTRLAQLDQPLVTNPLEKFLGPHQFGTYDQNKDGKDYAFVRIEDLWQEEVNKDSEDKQEDKVIVDHQT